MEAMTRDLHAVLAATGEAGPYLLVGRSFAAMRVRMLADRYPDEVVGLVLVDGDHEDAGLAPLREPAWYAGRRFRYPLAARLFPPRAKTP